MVGLLPAKPGGPQPPRRRRTVVWVRMNVKEIEGRSLNIGKGVCVGDDGRLMKELLKKGRGVNEDGDAMVCKVCGGQFLQKRE